VRWSAVSGYLERPSRRAGAPPKGAVDRNLLHLERLGPLRRDLEGVRARNYSTHPSGSTGPRASGERAEPDLEGGCAPPPASSPPRAETASGRPSARFAGIEPLSAREAAPESRRSGFPAQPGNSQLNSGTERAGSHQVSLPHPPVDFLRADRPGAAQIQTCGGVGRWVRLQRFPRALGFEAPPFSRAFSGVSLLFLGWVAL
jgi:hypothetical protein